MANTGSSASSPGAGPSSSSPQAGGDAHTPRQRQGRPPVRAGSDPLLIVCGCFSVFTAATALLCVAVNVVSAVQSFRAGSDVRGPHAPVRLSPSRRRPTPALGWLLIRLLNCSSADIRGHIPVIRGRLLALRRRPRDRVGVHHPLLEGWLVAPLSISVVQPTFGLVWIVRGRKFLVMLLPTRRDYSIGACLVAI